MARTQTLVQLTDDLRAALDQYAAKHTLSRSDVIRQAIRQFLASEVDAEIDRQIVDGYTRLPQEPNPGWEAALRQSIRTEPW